MSATVPFGGASLVAHVQLSEFIQVAVQTLPSSGFQFTKLAVLVLQVFTSTAFLQIAVMGIVAGETTTFQCLAAQGKLDSPGVVGLLEHKAVLPTGPLTSFPSCHRENRQKTFKEVWFMMNFFIADLVSNQSAEGLLEDCDLFGPARDDVLAMAVKMANVLDEPGQDLEADFPKSKSWVSQVCRAAQGPPTALSWVHSPPHAL